MTVGRRNDYLVLPSYREYRGKIIFVRNYESNQWRVVQNIGLIVAHLVFLSDVGFGLIGFRDRLGINS